MFGNRVTLFKLLGFEVKLDSSWIILAVLITWSLAKGVFPAYFEDIPAANYWAMGVAGAVGLFLSIILHELSHSLVARRFGVPMRGITLFIFGGVAEMSVEPPGAKAEFLTAVIGPDADALSVLGRMNETGNSRLLVVDNGPPGRHRDPEGPDGGAGVADGDRGAAALKSAPLPEAIHSSFPSLRAIPAGARFR